MRCLVHRETGWQVWWPVSIKETESKGGSLENNPFFDWKPVKHLRSDLACSWLTLLWGKIHLWLPSFEFSEACTVQLLTVYVNEQRVAVVQLTDNKRIRDIYEIYTRYIQKNWHTSGAVSFLVRRWLIEVILPISKYALLQDMLYHRQTSVRLNDHINNCHFYSAVSHWQRSAHRVLQDRRNSIR